jgi:hypothetical protein
MIACGLDALVARRGGAVRWMIAGVLALAVVVRVPPTASPTLAQWSRFAPVAYLQNPALDRDASAYAAIASHVRARGMGPLLDLPDTADGTPVVGQTIHRLPSVAFYTGYQPLHVSMVERLIGELPDATALDDLVDMTGLRWIVLRTEGAWPSPDVHARMRDALATHARTKQVESVDGMTLVELDPTSRHPDWVRSLAGGSRHGVSVLGTPLERLPANAGATVNVRAPDTAGAGDSIDVEVEVVNATDHGLGAAVPARPGIAGTVRLAFRWLAAGYEREPVELRRDVPAGESLVQRVQTTVPERPGIHRLAVMLRQVDGVDLTAGHAELEVTPTVH